MLRLQILGNLGQDAEIKHFDKDSRVINFSVAHTERYKKGDQMIENTHWVRCRLWNRNEKLAEHLKKGKTVFVEGMPIPNPYIDKNGEAQAQIELNVSRLDFV